MVIQSNHSTSTQEIKNFTKEVLYLRWNKCHLRAYFETLMTSGQKMKFSIKDLLS